MVLIDAQDVEAERIAQLQLVDERVDHSDRVVFPNEIVQAFRQQRDLVSTFALDESLHVAALCGAPTI